MFHDQKGTLGIGGVLVLSSIVWILDIIGIFKLIKQPDIALVKSLHVFKSSSKINLWWLKYYVRDILNPEYILASIGIIKDDI